MENLKKKILFYNGSLRMGGIERVLVEVLQNLDKDKYEIDLVIEDGIRSLNIFEKDIPKYINIHYLKSEELIQKTDWYRQRRKNLLYRIVYQIMMGYEGYIKRKKLKELGKKKKYDVVIDFDMGLSKFIDLIVSDKKIAWVHANIESWYKKKSRIERLGKRLKKYDRVVTICDAMRENTIKLYPFLKDKVMRIYNPFNFERIRILSEEKVDRELEYYLNEKYFVSVMRLTLAQKDFETLIKGFKIAKEKEMKEKLYILGDGPDKEKIRELIKKEKMEKEIFLLGNIKNPYPWIKNSEALVHSSKYEGLPTVLIEALILEKNVVSSDCPTGPREILDNENCGRLYEVGDFKKLSELLIKYLNEEERKKYLLNIERRKFDFEKSVIIKEYEKLIDTI